MYNCDHTQKQRKLCQSIQQVFSCAQNIFRENNIFFIDGVMDNILRVVTQDMMGFENGMCSNIALE